MSNKDWLETMLSEAEPYISDDDFSKKVMVRIPQRPITKANKFERFSIYGSTIIGSTFFAKTVGNWFSDHTSAIESHSNLLNSYLSSLSMAGLSATALTIWFSVLGISALAYLKTK